MERFLQDDKMQYTSVCCNLKPSCDEICTHCVLKWTPVFRLNVFRTSRRGNDLTAVKRALQYTQWITFVTSASFLTLSPFLSSFCATHNAFFQQDLDLRNSENTARYVFNRRGHITWKTDRQTDTYSHQGCVSIYCSCPLAYCCCCTIHMIAK